jgi:hypothetical protein
VTSLIAAWWRAIFDRVQAIALFMGGFWKSITMREIAGCLRGCRQYTNVARPDAGETINAGPHEQLMAAPVVDWTKFNDGPAHRKSPQVLCRG